MSRAATRAGWWRTLLFGAALLAVVGAVAAGGGASSARADELKVLSAGAVKDIVTEIAEAFRRETGHTIALTSGTAGGIRQKVAAGDPADVVIVTDTVLDQLAGAGLVLANTRADVAHTALGVAVRAGAPPPDISTVDAFTRALLAARSIVFLDPASGATSGVYFAALLQRLGIADAVKDKTLLWPGGFAAEAVASGRAELCVHQISEILPVKGVALVGPLPREIQKVTTYAAAQSANTAAPLLSRTFIAYVIRPSFKAKFAAAGLDFRE